MCKTVAAFRKIKGSCFNPGRMDRQGYHPINHIIPTELKINLSSAEAGDKDRTNIPKRQQQ